MEELDFNLDFLLLGSVWESVAQWLRARLLANPSFKTCIYPKTQQFHSQVKWNSMSNQYFYKNIYISLFHNSPRLETAQMFINRGTNDCTIVYSHNEILLCNEKEWATYKHNNIIESQIFDTKWWRGSQKCIHSIIPFL